MLKKVVIKNVNSIHICELDFAKGNYKYGEENVKGELVNPIVIYGHNGSGKSSVLNTFSQFISMLINPAETVGPFVVNNFKFDRFKLEGSKDSNLIKGSIDLFFELENKKYEYFLETSRKGFITEEYLKCDEETYFMNSNNSFTFKGNQYKYNNWSPNIPFLRILASLEISDSIIQMVFSYLSRFTHVNVSFINRGNFVTSNLFINTNVYDLLANKSEDVKKVLSNYDNFPRYSIVKDAKISANGMIVPQYKIVLEDGDFKGKLPISAISTGMQNQSMLLSLILSMPKNGVMFIDEADLALHPSTIKSFLKLVREKEIQVVFTIHNTYAMQWLRPDQIYFAKWSKGYSNYYRLSKIYPNIREINNIEKMYLSSIFDEAMNEE